MTLLRKTIRILLIVQTAFLGVTAGLGGMALVAKWNTPPLSFLNGSIFDDYTVPGISLILLVGGSALFSAILLIRNNQFAELASIAAGTIIMIFEFIEVLIIGSPAGVARFLQLFYFGLGVAIVFTAIAGELLRS